MLSIVKKANFMNRLTHGSAKVQNLRFLNLEKNFE